MAPAEKNWVQKASRLQSNGLCLVGQAGHKRRLCFVYQLVDPLDDDFPGSANARAILFKAKALRAIRAQRRQGAEVYICKNTGFRGCDELILGFEIGYDILALQSVLRAVEGF